MEKSSAGLERNGPFIVVEAEDGGSNTLFLHVRDKIFDVYLVQGHGEGTASRNAIQGAWGARDVRQTRGASAGHEKCVSFIDCGME